MSKQYKIITAGAMGPNPETASSELTQRVQDAIRDGWMPIGGVATVPSDSAKPIYLLQSMVKD